MSLVLTLWDRWLQPPREEQRLRRRAGRRDDLGPGVGMQDKERFVAGLSAVNLRREVKCGCVVHTPGKIEEV